MRLITSFNNFAHIASVLVGRHWLFTCWLALMVASAVGGWFFGRSPLVVKIPPGEETKVSPSRRSEAVAAVDSPRGQWTMRVKAATPADFPRLLEEWKTLFPDMRDGIESQQENSLRWLLAEWLVIDREGFVKAVTDKEFKSPHQAALVIARLNPELIVALRQFRTEMSGSRQREFGADLTRSICDSYSIESCISAAKLWAVDLNGRRDEETFKILAERSAAIDCDKTEASLDTLPEVARAAFSAEIVKRLAPEDAERRLALLDQLTPAQWDRDLGESLGKHGADYADAVFKLPASTTSEAQPNFMNAWVDSDPEAAISWFSHMSQNEAFGPAAIGLFEGWASFDSLAALAWAESLASGPFRQAVAFSVTSVLAEFNPREAWRWAATITDPEARAMAYDAINSAHRDGAPAEFKNEREAAIRAVGIE
jgi:hypothetical protein